MTIGLFFDGAIGMTIGRRLGRCVDHVDGLRVTSEPLFFFNDKHLDL
jgi:hypothetical protein